MRPLRRRWYGRAAGRIWEFLGPSFGRKSARSFTYGCPRHRSASFSKWTIHEHWCRRTDGQVMFLNRVPNATLSMHPHGVFYTQANEGMALPAASVRERSCSTAPQLLVG
jgi:hypothetical protein